MAIKGVDIQKILEDNRKKKGTGNSKQEKTGGILSMANNPMVQMAIQNIPKKYKVMIFLAFIFIFIGVISTISWICSGFTYYPVQSLKVFGGIIALILFIDTVYKVSKNKAGMIRVVFTVIVDALILYWIIF